ncbi:hypothetical protein [Craterilacuibacter sinensis]|uniref:Uncharacterized protein n=1 Tax=Craterilacuibacter sinensis TaxID=2686017 RepID=A0A845BP49_9NEIS|nr:hypothetical protein [Craterilacuibacter sinensis]MXR38145.1 hypothetical protein [Craterilacuibacter sinensis]
MSDTGEKATPFTSGSKLYHERARAALPILVRQAEAGQSLSYSDLATELEMPNARNLNFVLGSVGETLDELSKSWPQRIPPIQCLVVNKQTGLPGDGVSWFLVDKAGYTKLPLSQKRTVLKGELSHVFAYPGWRHVLAALELQPVTQQYDSLLAEAASFRGGGESDDHRRLKEYVALHPELVGLPASSQHGETEHSLPSGDSIDVSFRNGDTWVAVEVKSALSPAADLVRGIYQCVKYRAVMEAVFAAKSLTVNVRAVLVLQATLPPVLVPLRNTLGIEVVENVLPTGV